MLAASTSASAQEFAGIGLVPSEATLTIRIDRTQDTGRWIELTLEAVQAWRAPILTAWESTDLVVARLAPDAEESIHAIGPGGRRWLHAVRWRDPIQIQHGLQRLGSRPMGGGRYQLPVAGLEVVLLDRWFVLGPAGSPWLDEAADRARIEIFDAAPPALRQLVDELAPAAVEVVVKHPAPMGGVTAIAVHPRGVNTARLELAGRYDASPLPIRPTGSLEADVVARFDGRVACAVVESGIGLLDPLMAQAATRHPDLVPDAALRRRFAARRLLVLDGEAVTVPKLGIIEVPAACIAVPVADPIASAARSLDGPVDAWISAAGRSIRRTWTAAEATVTRTRGDEIRHLPLEPGLLEATDGHPMALAASLNWTVHEGPRCGTWFVAGTSPGLVRRVITTLDETTTSRLDEPLAMAGVASPARLSMQIAELGALRIAGGDAAADADAGAFAAAARILDRIERITWRTSRQDDRRLRATAEMRLVPGPTSPVVAEALRGAPRR